MALLRIFGQCGSVWK